MCEMNENVCGEKRVNEGDLPGMAWQLVIQQRERERETTCDSASKRVRSYAGRLATCGERERD